MLLPYILKSSFNLPLFKLFFYFYLPKVKFAITFVPMLRFDLKRSGMTENQRS